MSSDATGIGYGLDVSTLARMGWTLALICGCAEEPQPAAVSASHEHEPEPVHELDPPKPSPEVHELPAATSSSPDRGASESVGYGRGSGAGFGGRGKHVPEIRRPQPLIEGALEPDQIRKVVRKHLDEVRGCYIEATMRASILERVAIEIEIEPDGKVRAAEVRENTGKDDQFARCLLAAVRGWRFPKPADGEPVTVVYPFPLYPG